MLILQGHFSEKDASDKMRCLLDFIAFAHAKNIIHRDLKPENILLTDKTPTSTIKVIDFGTSDFCVSGQRLSQKFGTPYYVSIGQFTTIGRIRSPTAHMHYPCNR